MGKNLYNMSSKFTNFNGKYFSQEKYFSKINIFEKRGCKLIYTE